jgi:hypothetical protein
LEAGFGAESAQDHVGSELVLETFGCTQAQNDKRLDETHNGFRDLFGVVKKFQGDNRIEVESWKVVLCRFAWEREEEAMSKRRKKNKEQTAEERTNGNRVLSKLADKSQNGQIFVTALNQSLTSQRGA